MQICSDITPCKLPNRLSKTMQMIPMNTDAFLETRVSAVLYVKYAVIATKTTPAKRMATKLLPNMDMIAAKKAKVKGGFRSHNCV